MSSGEQVAGRQGGRLISIRRVESIPIYGMDYVRRQCMAVRPQLTDTEIMPCCTPSPLTYLSCPLSVHRWMYWEMFSSKAPGGIIPRDDQPEVLTM